MYFISSSVIIFQHSPSSTGPYIFLAFFLSYNLCTVVSFRGHCPTGQYSYHQLLRLSLYCSLQQNARHDLETGTKCFFSNHYVLTVKNPILCPHILHFLLFYTFLVRSQPNTHIHNVSWTSHFPLLY